VSVLAAYAVATLFATVYYEELMPVQVVEALASSASPAFYTTMWKDVVGTLVIFIFSVAFGNSSFYGAPFDGAWAHSPPARDIALPYVGGHLICLTHNTHSTPCIPH
jgi:hypothetical protein